MSRALLAVPLGLSALLAAGGPASGAGPGERLAAYRAFASDGRGARLARLARYAYVAAAGIVEPYPVDPPGGSGRPAGPRDEPPPPDWPEGPVGLVLCVVEGGKVRACEGTSASTSMDLGAEAVGLAERLARGGGRRRALPARLRAEARVQVAFVLEAPAAGGAPPPGAEAGFVASWGAGEEVVVPPSEAGTERRALRAARRARGRGRRGGEPALRPVLYARAGEAPVLTP
jgi:hypothetical protein